MKVLLVGGNGFIGKYLTKQLLESGYDEVFIIDKNFNKDYSKYHQYIGLISNVDFVSKAIENINPDIIYFLVSNFYIKSSSELEIAKKNSLVNIENILKANKQRTKIVFISSSAVYGDVNIENHPVNELHLPKPISFYGKLKLFEENVFRKKSIENGFHLLLARIFNIIGPNEPKRMVGGAFLNQLLKSDKLEVGNLFPKRDFVDVRDVAKCLSILGNKGSNGQVYNICSGGSISIEDLLNRIITELKLKNIPKIFVKKQRVNPFEINDLIGDNKKIIELGWKQKYTIESSIKDLIKSYKR